MSININKHLQGIMAEDSSHQSQMWDQLLDVCGLSCPLPLLKAKQALNKMDVGQSLRVIATDAGSMRDFKTFSQLSGHELIEAAEEEGRYFYTLKKSK